MTAIPPTPIDEIREPAWGSNPPPPAATPHPEPTGPAPSAAASSRSAPTRPEPTGTEPSADPARAATASAAAAAPPEDVPHHSYTLQDSGLHQGEVLHQVEDELHHDLGPLARLMHTDWDRARHAARAGWERLERMLPGHHRPH